MNSWGGMVLFVLVVGKCTGSFRNGKVIFVSVMGKEATEMNLDEAA